MTNGFVIVRQQQQQQQNGKITAKNCGLVLKTSLRISVVGG